MAAAAAYEYELLVPDARGGPALRLPLTVDGRRLAKSFNSGELTGPTYQRYFVAERCLAGGHKPRRREGT